MGLKLCAATLALLVSTGKAFPAAGSDPGEISLAALLFLAILGLIIAFQLYPAVMLLISIIKGICCRAPRITPGKGPSRSP